MYLLLGSDTDPCCAGVAARLDARGLTASIVAAPLASPAGLVWRLDERGVASRLSTRRPDSAIDGVLVRDSGWLDPAGWDKDDHAYMQAELRAVLLAWLAGLSCPVINPADATLWYRPAAPLIAWRSLLRRAGLPLPEVVITNDPAEISAFRGRLAEGDVAGGVYSPLSGANGYLLADDDDWRRLADMQKRIPVCLTEPHGAPLVACISGVDVIWNGAVPTKARAMEPALRRFAAAARLTFVEIALALVRGGLAVVMVDPHPRLEHFGERARDHICDALVSQLTQARAGAPHARLVTS
jgi:hypothetical protein